MSTNEAGTEYKFLLLQFCSCHKTKTSQILHILYSSAFYWPAKMPAELHCVVLHGVYLGYILISDLLQLSLLSCGVTCVLPVTGPSPTYTAHPTGMPSAWSKSNSVQGPALAQASFESHAVSIFLQKQILHFVVFFFWEILISKLCTNWW